MTEIYLKRLSGYRFEAKNSLGKTAILDGPEKIGGSDDGLRPMEMLLIGLAGCSSFDVLHTLKKGRQEVENFDVRVLAERAETLPSVFTEIKVCFDVSGKVSLKKLERAVELSMEKYCSAAAMLSKTAKISWECQLVGEES